MMRHITERIEDAFYKNRGVYGSPRIHIELQDQGIHAVGKRIVRLMPVSTYNATKKKKRRSTKTISNDTVSIAPRSA